MAKKPVLMPGFTRVEYQRQKAEGTCLGLPYRTDGKSRNGAEVLFWIGDRRLDNATRLLLVRAKIEMQHQRDCASFSYCEGAPSGYRSRVDYT